MNRARSPELSADQMQLRWVGNNEKEFAYLRHVLTRSGEGRLGLDRVRSPEEALQRLNQTTYDLLLCDYKPGDGMALRLLHEIRKEGPGAPVIFLSDHVDQIAVNAAIKAGASDCLQTSNLDESSVARAIRYAIDVYCKKTGQIFYAYKTITPLRDTDGAITHFISNDRDITERRRLESQLQQAQKMDAIGRLAGGVAHDFNNLLMVISAYAELMLDSLGSEHPLRRNVQEIMTASRRAADLTRQLLAFGRKQMQSLQLLDLNRVIQEINEMLPRLIGEDIQLIFAPGKNVGKVKADPVQIEQIVMNLAANARDAMPNGGKLTIETADAHLDESYIQRHSIVPPGEYVLLAVVDTVDGRAPEHVAHIFEPFYTTKAEGKGTGLGLATVYGIVKQNGGFIWVYSEPGLGTTFKIYLPCAQYEPDQKRPLKLF